MKRVASIVLNNFKNDSRVLKECISLQKAGYSVQVVALYDEGQKEFETIQEIAVHRIKLKSRSWSKRTVVQLLKYAEFVYKTVKKYKNFDIIHCNDFNTLPIGVIIKFFNKNAKVIYDAHEYETETYYLKGIIKKLAKIMEKNLIKYADKTITVSESIANEYQKLYGIEKPALVLNTPPLLEVKKSNIFREKFNIPAESKIFLYQGALTPNRGIELILDTFKKLNKSKNSPAIVFMGYGLLENLIKNSAKEHNNIFFHPAVPPEIVLNYTSSADFGISMIEDSCLSYRYCLPNKMFEYAMAGIGVVVSNLPEMSKIVRKYGIGVVAKDYTVAAMAEAINECINLDKEQLKRNLQELIKIYNWQEQEKVLLECYKEMLNEK